MKPLTYLLVDFENLQPSPEDVARIRGDEYRLWVFRGPHQKKYEAEVAEAWQPLGDKVQFVRSSKPGKNALDFHIAFQLGRLHREDVDAGRSARYVVVSGDGGFDALFEHARSLGCAVGKAPSIAGALTLAASLRSGQPQATASGADTEPAMPAPAPRPSAPATPQAKNAAKKVTSKPRNAIVAGDEEKAIADLRTHPKNRPADRKSLQRHIVSLLGNKVTAQVAEAVINALEARQVVRFEGKRATYKIPKAKT